MNASILTPDRRVRVFISSRIPEFAAERKALVRMIKRMNLTPIYFEELPRPHPPRELYSAYVNQSDIFLGIYGTGYGWVDIEGGMTISGVHDEWNLSETMPRIVFVKDLTEQRERRLEELVKLIESSGGVSYNRFKTSAELVKRAGDAIALCLTERFLAQETEVTETVPNYVRQLAGDLEKHPVIATRFFSEQLQPILTESKHVFIEGSPGAGKTVALYQLAKNNPSAIYLSLRNQSLLSATSHLVARLNEMAGKPVRRLTSAGEALEACEALLIKIPVQLLIDDVEQATDIAARLAGLSPGAGGLVFAGRFVPPPFLKEFRIVRCSGFVGREAEQYLTSALGSGNSIQTQAVIERAKGNPLYLRYYVEAPSPQPPSSLAAFHAAMWAGLAPQQQELLAVLALSEVALKFDEIAAVLGSYRKLPVTAIAAQCEVRQLGNLISILENHVRLFHPAFRDFVCEELVHAGLAKPIHRSLAEAFSKPSQFFLYVIHSVRGGMAAKVYDHLLRTAAWADITGRMQVSRELLAAALKLARQKRNWIIAGLALHQSADLKQQTRHIRSALLSASLAEKILSRSKAKEAAHAARISKAMFLIEVDRGDEAEVILRAAIDDCVKAGLSQAEAGLRVNLSYLYFHRGRLAQCAEESEKAQRIFEEGGDLWGVAVAILNAQNYYVATYDRPNQIRSFKRLLSIAKEINSPRAEMGAYNGMTVFYRREKKLDLAERVCLKAITLAKTSGFWAVEAINTGNLGNVYRDQNRYDKARECYETVIRIGTERGSNHQLAWGKEQLATIISHEGNIDSAIKMGEEALLVWRKIGEAYREASTEDDQGGRYRKLKRHFEAGKCFERAAAAWIRSGLFDEVVESFGRAYLQYVEVRSYNEAARCFESAWSIVALPNHANEALRMLGVLFPPELQVLVLLDLKNIVKTAAPLFSKVTDRLVVTDSIAALAGACKELGEKIGNKLYILHLQSIAECGTSPSANATIAFALSIEQAPVSLVQSPEFKEICSLFTEGATDLRYRNDLAGERWTIILSAPNAPSFELHVAEQAPGVRAASALIMLLVWAKREMVVKQIGKRQWRRSSILFVALSAEEAKKQGVEVPSYVSAERPGVLSVLSNPADDAHLPLPFIISDNFLAYADKRKSPNNNGSIWLTMLLYDGVLGNFTHSTIPPNKAKEFRREFISDVFGVGFAASKKREKSAADTDDYLFE